MNIPPFLRSILPHLIAAGVFLIILCFYFSPVFSGKVMVQSDMIHIIGSLKEANIYQEKTGEEILWSNSGFGGMPVWRGYGANVLNYLHRILTSIMAMPILLCFIAFIGFYILLKVFKVNNWLSFAGASAFAFSSFTIISIEAGHLNKVFDMALMAPVLAGVVLAYRGKFWAAAAVTTFFLSLHIFYGHIQITYYLAMVILFYALMKLILAVKEKTIPLFVKASSVLIISAAIAVIPNVSKLWTMAEHGKSSMRGGTELTASKSEAGGLDKEYALQWSNGISETMTLFIPYFYGGSSHEELGKSSEVYRVLTANGYSREAKEFTKSIPLYWGDQPFTAGPIYLGAIVCFLFVLGLFIVRDPIKWWILGATVLAVMLSWGRNLEWFTDLFFSYAPLYNKFRSVTMILSIAQLTVPLLGILALRDLLNQKISKNEILSGLKWSAIIMGGIALFFGLFGGSILDFTSENDVRQLAKLPAWMVEAIKEDRASKMQADSFRSLFFVLATAGLIWLLLKEKVNLRNFSMALSLLILTDMVFVAKRYLNNDDFKFNKNWEKSVFAKTSADEIILRDPDPHYRVMNLTKGLTSDATTSYHHKSLGGYSAIKLRRYQDIIDSALSRNNMDVINMLNTKYFIGSNKQTGELIAQSNPRALGNAWFVGDYELVDNADEEISAIQDFDPAETAIIDRRFKEHVEERKFIVDSLAKIRLTSYHPNRLSYQYETSSEQLAVFSEIYYEPGWNAYIDGNPAPHFRVNYILRGMVIPAGEHTIEFRFEPVSYMVGEKISMAGSILLVVFLLLITGRQLVVYFRKETVETRVEASL